MLRVRHLFPPNADWTLRDVLIDRRRRLGSGACGEVFAANWKGCRVSAKKIHDIFFDRTVVPEEQCVQILSEFARECALQAKMRHPHIVQLYGVQLPEEDDRAAPVMVSELMAETLRARVLRAPRLTLRDVIDMSLQIASALRFLHERDEPIAHRDLSANNVMLTSSGVCKVGDVGLAKIFTDARRVGTTMKPGTEPYMPGEVLSTRSRYNEKLDVFSLGVLMLEMSVRHEPRPTPEFLAEEEIGERTVLAPIPEVRRRQRELDELGREHPLRPLIERLFQPQMSRPDIGVAYEELERLRTHPAYIASPSILGNAESAAARLAGDVLEVRNDLREVRVEMDNLNRQQDGLSERLVRLEEKVREDMQSLRQDLIGELRLSIQQIGGEMRQWLESASLDIQREQHVSVAELRGDVNRVAASQEQLRRDVGRVAASQVELQRDATLSHELLQAISSVQSGSRQPTVTSPATASVGQRPAVCEVPLKSRQWGQLPSMPGKKAGCQAVRLENWVVVLCGVSQRKPSPRLCRRVFAFDTLSSVWEEWPSTPYALCAAGSDGKQLIIAGGCPEEGGDAVKHVFRLTLDCKNWEALTNMPKAMCVCSAAIQRDHLYVLGSCVLYFPGRFKDVKPTRSLELQMLNINTGVWSMDEHQIMTSVDGHLGNDMRFYSLVSIHDSLITDRLVSYDTEKKRSTDLPMRPGFTKVIATGYLDSGLTVLGSQLLACGGYWDAKVHVLSEDRTTWFELASMTTGRDGASACNVNGVVYIVGGGNESQGVLDSIESFQ